MTGFVMFKLLSRDDFRNSVFNRDGYKCVVCEAKCQDAHHIIERRLYPDSGYYIENGASLCGDCHLKAESTEISCEFLRDKIGITKFPLPPHMQHDQTYDKWGNPTLPNGQRLRGELFDDVSVQKIINPFLHLFTNRVKYPRTFHLPWSPGMTSDDRMMLNLNEFIDREVVITVKMDGENTTIYNDYVHARSVNFSPHPSRSRVKALQSTIKNDIPEGWRICGENLLAKHSISYQNLDDYFLMFSIWSTQNVCLGWDETLEWAELLGIKHVPVLYRGKWDEKYVRSLIPQEHAGDQCEGYVVRIADQFPYKQFRNCVGKYVRENHVQTDEHWMRSKLELNKVK